MGKKDRNTFYIDKEVLAEVKPYINEVLGMSVSQYMNNHLRDLKRVIDGAPYSQKKPSEMTLKEFGEVMQYWAQKADEED